MQSTAMNKPDLCRAEAAMNSGLTSLQCPHQGAKKKTKDFFPEINLSKFKWSATLTCSPKSNGGLKLKPVGYYI